MTVADLIRADAAVLIDSDRRFAGLTPGPLPIEVWGPGFGPLVRLILGQQVSTEAADAMYASLERTVPSVTPEAVLSLDDTTMRACGFTKMKAEYARGIAQAELGGFSIAGLTHLGDEAIVAELTTRRGIGRWTAECYLLFCLGRRDVFPGGDLALEIGLQEITGSTQRPSPADTATTARAWAPRRTAAAYLVWYSYLQRRGRL